MKTCGWCLTSMALVFDHIAKRVFWRCPACDHEVETGDA